MGTVGKALRLLILGAAVLCVCGPGGPWNNFLVVMLVLPVWMWALYVITRPPLDDG